MTVTQQYLAGELSVLLAGLLAAAAEQPDRSIQRDIAGLREAAETLPPSALGSVARRALRLGDALCWEAMAHGDMTMFDRAAEVSAELYEFGLCAGLVQADHDADHDWWRAGGWNER